MKKQQQKRTRSARALGALRILRDEGEPCEPRGAEKGNHGLQWLRPPGETRMPDTEASSNTEAQSDSEK